MFWGRRILFGVVLAILVSSSSLALNDAFFSSYPFHAAPSSKFLRVLKVREDIDCGFACLKTPLCLGFNFATKVNLDGMYLCQLLPTDQRNRGLTTSPFFHHYKRIDMDPCQSSPCHNGGKCSAVSDGLDFSCFCSPSFIGKTCDKENWLKISSTPRCFGSRDSKFTSFIIQKSGMLLTMKLVHVNGSITCDISNANGWNNWGCLSRGGTHQYMSVVMTTTSDSLLLPERPYFIDINNKVYNFPGCDAKSSELIFPKLSSPVYVSAGQTYRVWFGQDLSDVSEMNNGGTICVDVYGLYE